MATGEVISMKCEPISNIVDDVSLEDSNTPATVILETGTPILFSAIGVCTLLVTKMPIAIT